MINMFSLIDLTYNFMILFLLFKWRTLKFKSIYILFLAPLFIVFNLLSLRYTDVDDALTAGAQALLKGANPYNENVSYHEVNKIVIWGYYNYFPINLLAYSFFYLIFGFTKYWYVIGNLLLLPIILKLTPKKYRIPLIALCSAFIFNNSFLMLAFFVVGRYFEKRNDFLAVVFYSLSAMVKFIAGLYLLIYILRKKKFLYFLIPTAIFIITSFPFGVYNVAYAAFVQQLVPKYRAEVALVGGPFITDLLIYLGAKNFIPFVLFAAVIISLFYYRKKDIDEQTITASFIGLLLTPWLGTELLVIPLYQIITYNKYLMKK